MAGLGRQYASDNNSSAAELSVTDIQSLQGFIIGILKRSREWLSLADLEERVQSLKAKSVVPPGVRKLNQPLSSLEQLQTSLQVNDRVKFADGKYRYKPKYDNVLDKAGLLELLRSRDEAFIEEDLADCYTSATTDLDDLMKDENKEWRVFRNYDQDTKKSIVYFQSMRIDNIVVEPVSERVRTEWLNVVMPTGEGELERAIVKQGHMKEEDVTRRLKRKVATQKRTSKTTKKVRKRAEWKNQVANVNTTNQFIKR